MDSEKTVQALIQTTKELSEFDTMLDEKTDAKTEILEKTAEIRRLQYDLRDAKYRDERIDRQEWRSL